MDNIRHIKKFLCEEQYAQISQLTGYSVDYIQNCLLHRRNNRLIAQAAVSLGEGGSWLAKNSALHEV